MATYSKLLLGNSSYGMPVLISATGTNGTLIHTAVAGTSDFDEVWLWAQNTYTSDQKLTVEWGSTTGSCLIEVTIPFEEGLILVSPGLLLHNGLEIRAFSPIQNALSVHGFINRITA